MKKGHSRHLSSCFLLLTSCYWLLGAGVADFPLFKMEDLDFETARDNTEEFKGTRPETIEVPKVSERLYGEGEQDRLPVEKIVIEGVVPHLEQNISQDIIQGIIDDKFRELQATDLDENGFTKRDLDDIGKFLADIRDGGSAPDAKDMEALMYMVGLQEYQREWITIEQLDAIALTVTEYYREKGFILATAFIPEQEVADGIIHLSVLEGRLGAVTVSNNEIFSDATIRAAFNDEIGKPVTESQIESTLRRINDLPGVRVRGSFSPGDNVGETSLNLGVLEEQAWTSSIRADNHGSPTTGENRVFATTQWLNIRNKGHKLVIGILRSEGPDSTTYGLAEYEMPITADGKARIRGGISTNQFTVTRLATLPTITGETDNISLNGSYQFIRSRTLNFKAQVGYTYKDALFKVGELTTLSTDQQIQTISTAVDYTQLWDERQLLLTGRFGVDYGHIIKGEVRDQSADFTKVLLSANLLKRFSINNWLTKNVSSFNFVAKLNTQFTEEFLSSVEQFSLGGPTAVRAFGVSDVSVDSGAYGGLELFFDLPVDPLKPMNWPLEPLKPYVFYDYAYGVARGLVGARDRDAIIKGYGFGMRVNWPGKVVANLIVAKPQSAKYQNDFLDAQGDSRIYLDVTYQIK